MNGNKADNNDETFMKKEDSILDFSSIKRNDESFMAKGINFGDISKINNEFTLNQTTINAQLGILKDKNEEPSSEYRNEPLGNILE